MGIVKVYEGEGLSLKPKQTIKDIAKSNGVSLEMVLCELERGCEAESKYTESKVVALRDAIDNLRKSITYYSDMDKLDNLTKQK